MDRVKAKKIYQVASLIKPRMNKNKIIELFKNNNMEIEYLGRGAFKRAFKIKLNKNWYVLKVGNNVKREFDIYKKLRKRSSPSLFKIYWCEDYVCLQKYSNTPTYWGDKNLDILRNKLGKFCSDIRPANCGYDNKGKVRCFDIGRIKNKELGL